MCHCEGDVDYRSQKGGYHKKDSKDSMAFTGAKRTVLLTPQDLKAAGLVSKHHHSMIADSPPGPREGKMPPEKQAALRKLIRGRFSQTGRPGR